MAEGKDYGKYMVKGSTIVFAGMAITAIIGTVLRIVLARSLPPDEYGLFFAIIAFVSFFTLFRHLGLNRAVTKFLPDFRAKERLDSIKSSISTALIIETILTVSITVIFISLSGWLSTSFFGTSAARPVFIILSIWFSVQMLIAFLRSVFRGFGDMVGFSAVEIIRMVITFALVVMLVFFFKSSLNLIGTAYLFGVILAVLLSFALLRNRHSDLLGGENSVEQSLAKKLLAFGLPLMIAGTATTILARTDTLMLTAFRSLEDVGLYQVALPTARFLRYFGVALAVPMLPMVSEMWAKEDKEALRSVLYFLSKFSLIFIVPIGLIFLAFPEEVIGLLFGAKYLEAATALQILSISSIFIVGTSIFGPTLSGTGHPTYVLMAAGCAAILNVPANFLLVPPYGAGGAAIATSLSYLLSLVLLFYYQRKIIGFPVPVGAISKTILGGSLTLFVIFGLKSVISLPLWPSLFVILTPSFLFYVTWIFRTNVATEKDLETISRVIPIPKFLVKIVKRLFL